MRFDPIITVTMNPAIDRVLAVEHFRIGEHRPGRERARLAGGKGVNVSKALARLGVESIVTGFLGRENSRFFESLLLGPAEQPWAARLKLQFFLVAGLTRENVTILDTADQTETHVRDVGAETAERDLLRLKRKLGLMSRPGALVVFGGGLPPGVGAERFEQLVEVCRAAGADVAVDTSGPALQAVRNIPLLAVKPNRLELADLLGRDVPDNRAALVSAGRELAGRFSYVLISLGSEGGLAFQGRTALAGRVPIAPSRIVSTVGCGDCLLAGFIAGLREGKDLADAYRLGLATATANVLGGGPAEFEQADLEEMLTRVELEEIDSSLP